MTSDSSFRMESFPLSRHFTIDMGRLALRKHRVCGLIEVDVTDARIRLHHLKSQQGASAPSFTAWILKCLAQAVHEHPQVHALRHGRRRRVLFHDVDISVMVERELENQPVPLPIVLRSTQAKSVLDIQGELQAAKEQNLPKDSSYVLGGSQRTAWLVRGALLLPRSLRLLVWRLLLRNPFLVKKMMGTVILSSLGSAGAMRGWAIPLSIHPLALILGSIAVKPAFHDGQIMPREYLPITILVDHDVVDGMPSARFVTRLTQMMESSSYL